MTMMERVVTMVMEMLVIMMVVMLIVMNLEVPPDTIVPRGNQRARRRCPQREPDHRTSCTGSTIMGVTWDKSLNLSGPWFPTWQLRADILCPAPVPGLGEPWR